MTHQDSNIRTISAAQTRPLRAAVLRPQQTPEELVYPGDDASETRHFGAERDGELIGIASVCREPPPGEADPAAWRLRGMATRPEVRGQGYGRALLRACLDYAAGQGGSLIWCNARTTAAGFYRAFGFEARGGEFELPGIGPHLLMTRPLGKSKVQ